MQIDDMRSRCGIDMAIHVHAHAPTIVADARVVRQTHAELTGANGVGLVRAFGQQLS